MNILKKLLRTLLDRCIHCGCSNFDYSSKKSHCPCGCDMRGVTKEAEFSLDNDSGAVRFMEVKSA